MSAPNPAPTNSAPTGSTSVTAAGPPPSLAAAPKEPAPSAPPIPGMGTDAHSAQEALDKVAQEPTFFGKMATYAQPYLAKVDAVTQPYVEKVQTTTKPYTDAAAVKARELMDKIDGPGEAAPGTTTSAAAFGGDGATNIGGPTVTERRASKGLGPEIIGASGTPATSTTGAAGEKQGVFDTITKSVSDFTHKVDEKTATADHPGLFTQLASAVQKVTDKADAYISSHAPTATNPTSTTGHPIQTTTNSVPHTDKPTDAPPPVAAAGAPSAVPAVPVVPVVPAAGPAVVGGPTVV